MHAERLHLGGRVAACISLLLERGIDPALPHGLPRSYLWLAFLRPLSGAHRHSATATVQVGHIASLCFSARSSDDLLLRLSSVDLMPRLGLNSIHSTTLRSSLARRSSLSA